MSETLQARRPGGVELPRPDGVGTGPPPDHERAPRSTARWWPASKDDPRYVVRSDEVRQGDDAARGGAAARCWLIAGYLKRSRSRRGLRWPRRRGE